MSDAPAAPAPLDDVVLRTARLDLRPLTSADAPAIAEAMRDRSLHEFLPLPDPYTEQDARAFVAQAQEQRRRGVALVCGLGERDSGRLVGTSALYLPSGRTVGAEIGYAVYPGGRGRGYAAEATRELTRWGLALGLPRVELRMAVGNVASARVALAAGHAFEGIERASVAVPDGLADGAVFARVPGDPDHPRPPALPPLPRGGLGDGTVLVRPLTRGDADLVVAEARDPEALRWSLFEVDEARLRAGTERAGLEWLVGRHFRMAVVDVASGEAAGTIALYAAGPPGTAVVGYGVLPRFRRRGVASRALRLVTAWSFRDAGLAHLDLGTHVDNVASQRVAEAAGFGFVAVSRGYLRHPDGTRADERRYELSAADWADPGEDPGAVSSRISP